MPDLYLALPQRPVVRRCGGLLSRCRVVTARQAASSCRGAVSRTHTTMPHEVHRLHAMLRAYCAAKPFVVEIRIGRETFFRGRGGVFAFMGTPRRPAVTVRVPTAERGPLLRHPSVMRARWIGWLGWLTVTVSDRDSLDLAMQLVDRSYEAVAGGRRR